MVRFIKKIIIASHGNLAEGYKNTLGIIAGTIENLEVMSFYNGKDNYDAEINEIFDNLKDNDQLIVCTDIKYGSINQLFVRKVGKVCSKNIMIISGINLPLILEIITYKEIITKEKLQQMIESARKELLQVDIEALICNCDNDELV